MVNGDLLNYKSYEFSDSSFTTATITDMVEQYWPNISGNTYGLVRYSNNSSIWIGTYIKYGNDDGAITINGISAYSPFQRGVLIKSVWKWDPIVRNSDLNAVFNTYGLISDPDAIIKPGMYYAYAGSSNAPEPSNGYLYMHFSVSDRTAQFAIGNTNTEGYYYIRTKSTSSQEYSKWRKIVTEAI